MKRAYYIESKSYYQDSYGTDHQVADGGELPIIYLSLKDAIKRCESMIKLVTEKMGYKVVISSDNYPGVGKDYHFACRLTKINPEIRLEIRLYSIIIL